MRTTTVLIILFFLLFVGFPGGAAQAETASSLERYALIVGANDGGGDRITLRYADDDAEAMAAVLEDLGGVSPKNRIMLLDPDRQELVNSLERLREMVGQGKTSGRRIEVFFYYSGHSDESGLLLFGRTFRYADLKQKIKELDADVRVVILDSCSSGAMTRTKGGKRKAPFLADASVKLKGHAILTSSAENEAAQESDKIGGSFFTHYLVSGMRGAADASHDRRVTLDEAYHYAFTETLGRTQTTQSGAQHASYDIQLSGTGNLVLTELSETYSTLHFTEELQGRLYVRDSRDRLVSEINKEAGKAVDLGVEPGEYRIVLDRDGEFSMAEFSLDLHGVMTLDESAFHPVESESTVARGLGAKEKKYTDVPFNLGLFPPVHINKAYDGPIENHISLGLFANEQDRLRGLAVTFGVNWQNDDMEGVDASFLANVVERDSKGAAGTVFTNITRRDFIGAQYATFYNHTDRHFIGGQFALVNYTGGNFIGGQGGLVNIAVGDMTGAQLALTNFTIDHATGAQAALVNIAMGNMTGVHGALANVTIGDVHGFELGLGNVTTGKLTGAQFGHLNVIAGDEPSKGGQLGLLNVSRGKLSGAQIGFINYADDVDVPIGFLSIVRKGVVHGDFWTSDTALVNAALKLGSRLVYNLLMVGYQPVLGDQVMSYGLGLGFHLPVRDGWHIDFDLTGSFLHKTKDLDQNASMVKLRLLGEYPMTEHVSLLFGPTFNVMSMYNNTAKPSDFSYIPYWKVQEEEVENKVVRVYASPGFMIGIEI